jgi:predicted permease
MINFILIGICISAGLILQFSGNLAKEAHKGINAWILYLALPAASLKYIPTIEWSCDLIFPAITPLIVWIGAWVSVNIYSFKYKISKSTKASMILTGGLANTSFLGFPLIMAYYGEKELSIGIICDQISFIILSTLGIILAIKSSQRQALNIQTVLLKLLKFPPFIAFVLALVLPNLIDISPAIPLFDKLASTIGPLALFSIGLQLKFVGWRTELRNISVGIIYKLLIAPALVLLIALTFHFTGIVAKISVFEASMATMITAGVLADEYSLNTKVSSLIVGIGILLSFITTAFWWLIIEYVF